jgi:hypothetical protein
MQRSWNEPWRTTARPHTNSSKLILAFYTWKRYNYYIVDIVIEFMERLVVVVWRYNYENQTTPFSSAKYNASNAVGSW